ncbi:MAG: TOMM precursor leader peptide-binding protein, partial [Candidatus Parabeggiatoa sp.]|nr:TOMM precursor leader peptide-binding protein [Candidatus Parabeggiatoa sp.]
MHKPQLKHCFHVEIIEAEGVFLLSENQSALLKGHLYQHLVPLINGQHTVDNIVDLMHEQASAAEVYYALMLMEQKGYLVESDEHLPTAVAAFYETLNVDTTAVVRKLQQTKVVVRAIGTVSAEPLIAILESLSIQVQGEGELEVILTDDYLQNDLQTLNQKALQSQRPWMLIKPVGTLIWIGPLFLPGKTGCWECFAQRLRANRPVESFIQKRKAISTPFPTSVSALPSTVEMGLNLAATEIAKWIIQADKSPLVGQLVTFDTLSLETQQHRLTQRPQCPSCGQPEQPDQAPQPFVLQSQRKTFMADGGHRCLPPEDTLKQYQHHISPITGVVRELRSVSQTENGPTHIYIAGHNVASMFDELFFLRHNLRGRSSGKGKTDSQAKASAFGEAVERYSGLFQGDEIRKKGRYEAIGEAAIHPNVCMNFSDNQYQNRHQWNTSCYIFQKVPEPFDTEREIDWTPVWSLTHKTFKYLPTAYCYYGYPKPPKPDCWADSNGAAAGNTKEEAILQGFMEVVERDSVALWWYNRIKRPVVDLDSFEEPYVQSLKDYYQTCHRAFWLLDITSDITIPSFAAISRRTDKAAEDIVLGFGTHFDAKIAILRALTEMNQMFLNVSYQSPEGHTEYASDDPSAIHWWKTATCANQTYLVPDDTSRPKVCSDYPPRWSEDLLEDVMTC